jgi:hypothetical protein
MHIVYTQVHNDTTPVPVAKTSPDPAKSERQLVRWNTPRAAAVAAELTNASIGRRRGELVQVAAGHSRRITVQERRRSESILPRLSDGRINTNTDGTGVGGVCVHWHAHSQYLQAGIQGYHAYRQVTTKVNGRRRTISALSVQPVFGVCCRWRHAHAGSDRGEQEEQQLDDRPIIPVAVPYRRFPEDPRCGKELILSTPTVHVARGTTTLIPYHSTFIHFHLKPNNTNIYIMNKMIGNEYSGM